MDCRKRFHEDLAPPKHQWHILIDDLEAQVSVSILALVEWHILIDDLEAQVSVSILALVE